MAVIAEKEVMTDMAMNLISVGVALAAPVSYITLGILETVGILDPMTVFEKFGISGGMLLLAYIVVKYLLNDRKRLEEKIDKMHEDRIEREANFHNKIVEILEEKKK